MKKLCLSIMIMLMCMPLFGYTLKGGVTYTVETARKEAFANVEYTLPKSIIEANMFDPHFRENIDAIKIGRTDFVDRHISHFSSGGYVIIYKNDLYKEFYYTNEGRLNQIGVRENLICPVKSFKYNIQGKLENVILSLKKGDNYIFDKDGKLTGHWINGTCYDQDGKVIDQRY